MTMYWSEHNPYIYSSSAILIFFLTLFDSIEMLAQK